MSDLKSRKKATKEPKLTYFDVLADWNSGSDESYKDPEAFKLKFQASIKTEGEDKYIERRLTKLGVINE